MFFPLEHSDLKGGLRAQAWLEGMFSDLEAFLPHCKHVKTVSEVKILHT